jgi:glycosyltransferase involved in cell wall biosynthesis
MKILQVNKLYSPWIGGIETVAEDIAEYFNGKEGYSVTNLVCQSHGARKFDEVNGVPTWRASSWGIVSGMPLSLDFFRLFKKLAADADVIVLHHPFPLAFIAYRLFGRGKKLVVWYHSDIVKQRFTKLPFMPSIRYALRKAEYILVSNRAIIKNSSLLCEYSEKCHVIYFGIDPERFRETAEVQKKAEEIRKKYGEPLVLSVGRLVYYKGFLYLIAAMKDVSAHLLIVGNGPMKDILQAEIEELGIGAKIHIIDPVDDLVPYYHACDVFALPSCESSEVFGIVQIEAMACGKPVVNTSLPTGVPEVSVDGNTGRTVPPKDAAALAGALNEVLGDKDEYRRFSENAVADVAARFTKEKFGAEMEKYLL